MIIGAHEYEDYDDAYWAASGAVCAYCSRPVKVQHIRGRWLVLCTLYAGHRGLRR